MKLLSTAACFRGRALRLLYHLSVDDRCKSMFGFTASTSSASPQAMVFSSGPAAGSGDGGHMTGLALLLGMVVNFPQEILPKELAALMINITHNKSNCNIIIQHKGVSKLMERLLNVKGKDALLLKIIRNLSQFTFLSQQVVCTCLGGGVLISV